MTIYHPNIILRETRRHSAAEFFHRISIQKKLIELMEKGRFSSYALKIFRNVHKSIILRSVKTVYSIKNIKVFRKTDIQSLVLRGFFYIGCAAACFFATHFFASNALPLVHLAPLSSALSVFLGLAKHRPSTNDKSDRNSISDGETGDDSKGAQYSRKNNAPEDDFLKLLFPEIDDIEWVAETGISVVAYVRVSTPKQTLDAQKEELRDLAKRIGVARIIWLVDAGISGRDFDRRKINTALAIAEFGKISKMLAAEIDRIGRQSIKLLGFLITLRSYGVKIHLPKGELDLEKMYDFFTAVIKSFEAQGSNDIRGHYATRGKVFRFRRRKWIFDDAPIGYVKWRGWIKKSPGWDLVITRIFELYLMHRRYTVVTEKINEEFKAFLKEPISRSQITVILENHVYIGKPSYGGDVVKKDFGEVAVDDPSLRMVPDDLFDKVQAIIQEKRAQSPHRQELVEELVETLGFDVLEFLPYVKVHCRHCDGIMRSGGGSDYVCTKCGRHLVPVGKKEVQKILEWFFKREKGFAVLKRLVRKYKWKLKSEKLIEFLERKFNKKTKEEKKVEQENPGSSIEKEQEGTH